MAAILGLMGGNYGYSSCSASSSSSWIKTRSKQKRKEKLGRNRVKVFCSALSVMDPYKTLRIQPNASETEVKKAFRQLALKFHPDVCRLSNCGVQFHQINEAYDIVMSNIRGEPTSPEIYEYYEENTDEPMRGMEDPDWDMWEEWMGWEGAGIRDYSSHINPYI